MMMNKKEQRKNAITVRVTDRELLDIVSLARKSKTSVSRMIRLLTEAPGALQTINQFKYNTKK